jgi:pantetheine-phosphate adenylyltransferase
MSRRIALYPGTFDPVTCGHIDIVTRAARLADTLIVAVAANAGKGPLFTLDERVAMVKAEVDEIAAAHGLDILVRPFDSLLIDFARQSGAKVIIRGLRAISDFEYEFQMAGMNARLAPDIETAFLMASERCQFISSRFIKEIGRLGGDISSFVSSRVKARLDEKF